MTNFPFLKIFEHFITYIISQLIYKKQELGPSPLSSASKEWAGCGTHFLFIQVYHWNKVAIVLQHHIPLQVSLSRVQLLPLLLSEVHSHIFEWHKTLRLGHLLLLSEAADIAINTQSLIKHDTLTPNTAASDWNLFWEPDSSTSRLFSLALSWKLQPTPSSAGADGLSVLLIFHFGRLKLEPNILVW